MENTHALLICLKEFNLLRNYALVLATIIYACLVCAMCFSLLIPRQPTLRDATRLWARIALLSFGGPAAQIALMHRMIVDERKWVSEQRFLHALNYCMLLPGPEAQQLAVYLGWMTHGARGGVIAGGLFVLPGALVLFALSAVYALYGRSSIVAGAFFGLKAAALAIVAQALARIAARTLKSIEPRAIASAAFAALFFFHVPFPLVVLAAGAYGLLRALAAPPAAPVDAAPEEATDDAPHLRPAPGESLKAAGLWLTLWLSPTLLCAALLGPDHVFARIGFFFSRLALTTFGGAYAALAYVAQDAVERQHWLAPGEMLDGLGMAETTPGPLVIVLQFVGFMAGWRDSGAMAPLLAGALGGFLASWATFTPSFLWVLVGAPYIERLRDNAALTGALSAIMAAVVGVIFNLALWFAIHTLFAHTQTADAFGLAVELPVLASANIGALTLSAGAALALVRFNAGAAATLGGCALLAIVATFFGAGG